MLHKDINGKVIKVGDVIAESTVGKIIWNGLGKITIRPYGIVFHGRRKLNVMQLMKGKVLLLRDDKVFGKEGDLTDINLSRYDGQYEWPNEIEIIGHINCDGD